MSRGSKRSKPRKADEKRQLDPESASERGDTTSRRVHITNHVMIGRSWRLSFGFSLFAASTVVPTRTAQEATAVASSDERGRLLAV